MNLGILLETRIVVGFGSLGTKNHHFTNIQTARMSKVVMLALFLATKC